MSRIGKKPVVLPAGVKADLKDGQLTVTGPKGSLAIPIHPKVLVTVSEAEIIVDIAKKEDKKEKALWGLFRSLVQNLVDGVSITPQFSVVVRPMLMPPATCPPCRKRAFMLISTPL